MRPRSRDSAPYWRAIRANGDPLDDPPTDLIHGADPSDCRPGNSAIARPVKSNRVESQRGATIASEELYVVLHLLGRQKFPEKHKATDDLAHRAPTLTDVDYSGVPAPTLVEP